MDGQDIGLTEAISEAQHLRRRTGAKSITLRFRVSDGEVAIIVDHDGYEMFVNGEVVPIRGAA